VLLPDVEVLPTSYEIIGSIIHFNLPKTLSTLQKQTIGQVYLDVLFFLILENTRNKDSGK
jgi:tRNA G37 N-methylase Trm5